MQHRNLVAIGALSCVGWMTPGVAHAQSNDVQTMPELVSQGRANIGFHTVFNFTRAQNELEMGDDVVNSTLFLLATPKFGYFLADGVEFVAQAGLLTRRLEREVASSTENNLIVDLGVNYHAAVSKSLAFVPGVGVGGYFGGSSRLREVTEPDGTTTELNESTDTFGLDVYGQFGVAYRVRKKTTINAGLVGHFLYGAERAQSSDDGLTVSTVNVGLNFGLAYTF